MGNETYVKMDKICIVSEDFSTSPSKWEVVPHLQSLCLLYSELGYAVDLLITSPDISLDSEYYRSLSANIIGLMEQNFEGATLPRTVDPVAKSFFVYRFIKSKDYKIVNFINTGALGYFASVARRQGLLSASTMTHCFDSSRALRKDRRIPIGQTTSELEALETLQVQFSDYLCLMGSALDPEYEFKKSVPARICRNTLLHSRSEEANSMSHADESSLRSSLGRSVEKLFIFCHQEEQKHLPSIARAILGTIENFDLELNFVFVSEIQLRTIANVLFELTSYPGPINFVPCADAPYMLRSAAGLDNSLCLVFNDPDHICASTILYHEEKSWIISLDLPSKFVADGNSPPSSEAPSSLKFQGAKQIITEISAQFSRNQFRRSHFAHKDSWSRIISEAANLAADRVHSVVPNNRDLNDSLPKVSICVTHHDRPDFLARALLHISRQTYKNIEVVIVDDGSKSPASVECVRRLAAEKHPFSVKLILTDNRYLGAARNVAATNATGELLYFHDDDNYLLPGAIACLVDCFGKFNADVLLSLYYVVEEGRQVTGPEDILSVPIHPGAGGAFSFFKNRFGDASALIRKKVFDLAGGYSEKVGVGYEDWEFFLKLHLRGYVVSIVPEPLYYYQVSKSSMLGGGDVVEDFRRVYALIGLASECIQSEVLEIASFNEIVAELDNRFNRFLSASVASHNVRPLDVSQKIRGDCEWLLMYSLSLNRKRDAFALLSWLGDISKADALSRSYYSELQFDVGVEKNYIIFDPKQSGTRGNYILIEGWSNTGSDKFDWLVVSQRARRSWRLAVTVRSDRRDVAKQLGVDSRELGFLSVGHKSSWLERLTTLFSPRRRYAFPHHAGMEPVSVVRSSNAIAVHLDYAWILAEANAAEIWQHNEQFIKVEFEAFSSGCALILDSGDIVIGAKVSPTKYIFNLRGNDNSIKGKPRSILVPSNQRARISSY